MEYSEKKAPRITNRGAQNTEVPQNSDSSTISTKDYSEKGELKSLIDWFEFTIPINVPFEDIFTKVLRISKDEFTSLEKNILGYSDCYINGHILVLTNGTAQMGHHVQMSGQGCREYEMYLSNYWKHLFISVLERQGKFSRLDLAIDDFHGYFSIPDIIERVKNGWLCSRFKRAKRIEDILISDGTSLGNTLYFGRGSSRIQVRMYEKNYEQEVNEEIEVWNRTELQLRDERASIFAKSYSENTYSLGKIIRSVLSHYLDFKDPDEVDTNKSRWKTSQFWLDFLGDIEDVKLTTKKPDRTMDSIERWLRKQTSKSIAMLALVKPEELEKLVLEGQGKLTERDEQLVFDYIKQANLMKKHFNVIKNKKRASLLEPRRMQDYYLDSITGEFKSIHNQKK